MLFFLTSKRTKVCCNFGSGSVSVFLGAPSDETLLAFVDGTFTDQAVRPFVASARGIIQRQVTVPSPVTADTGTASPTATPTSGLSATPTTESAGKTWNASHSETNSQSQPSLPTSKGTLLTLGEYNWLLVVSMGLYFLNWYL